MKRKGSLETKRTGGASFCQLSSSSLPGSVAGASRARRGGALREGALEGAL